MGLFDRFRKRPAAATTRRYHLGVDFGTCWSKLVLRDYGARAPTSQVVVPSRRFGGATTYRVPSRVVMADGRLWFGGAASRAARDPSSAIYDSVKMRAAVPSGFFRDETVLPSGISAEDLATLVVLFLLEIGREAAEGLASSHKATARLTMTMGAPMSLISGREGLDTFVRIARTAFHMSHAGLPSLKDGVSLFEARAWLDRARTELASLPGVSDPREWVRSEAEAAVLWAFRSPQVPAGLYGCVDVGAGTTDVSFFRIVQSFDDGVWVKDRLAFYSAHSGIPGVDAIDRVIVRKMNGHSGRDPRGHEHEIIERLRLSSDVELSGIGEQVFAVHRSAWAHAYAKEKRQSSWDPFNLFLLGGGNRIGVVSERLSQTVWDNILQNPRRSNPGVPTDLRLAGDGLADDDATFLLVAYGLSYLGLEVPEAQGPTDTSALELDPPNGRGWDQDEYYPR